MYPSFQTGTGWTTVGVCGTAAGPRSRLTAQSVGILERSALESTGPTPLPFRCWPGGSASNDGLTRRRFTGRPGPNVKRLKVVGSAIRVRRLPTAASMRVVAVERVSRVLLRPQDSVPHLPRGYRWNPDCTAQFASRIERGALTPTPQPCAAGHQQQLAHQLQRRDRGNHRPDQR